MMIRCSCSLRVSFFFNYTATTKIYTYLHTLSLHDALPISQRPQRAAVAVFRTCRFQPLPVEAHEIAETPIVRVPARSEEHTSELQSLMRISYAVFCLKKKTTKDTQHSHPLSYRITPTERSIRRCRSTQHACSLT